MQYVGWLGMLIAIGIVMGVAIGIVGWIFRFGEAAWIAFRWRLMGYRPVLIQGDLLEHESRECAGRCSVRAEKEEDAFTIIQEECRKAIEQYMGAFVGRETRI